MSVTTYTHTSGASRGASFGGRIRRFFASLVEAQERHVSRRVARILSMYDDAYLKELGYSPAEIARLRGRKAS